MRDQVFIVAEGAQHLPVASSVAGALHAAGMTTSLLYPHVIDERTVDPVYRWVISDIYAIPGALKHAALVLFFTHESSPYCMFSNKIGLAANLTGTPRLTVQHGWIQPGLNYEGDCRRIGYIGRGSDNSAAITHFSDVVRYDGDDGIGYPRLPGDFQARIRIPRRVDLRVLLATNFNWGVYRRESIIGFLRAIEALKLEFPGLTFMHRAHAAEKSQGLAAELGVYMELIDAKAPPAELDEALASADLLITTPSTIALDGLASGLPVFVYRPEEFAAVNGLIGNAGFRDARELVDLTRRLIAEADYVPPPVKPFVPERLVERIRAAAAPVGEYALTDEAYLRYVQLVK